MSLQLESPPLSGNQRRLLRLIRDSFVVTQRWPSYRWLNQIAFVEHGIEDFDREYAALPSGMALPEANPMFAGTLSDNPISLTLEGLVALNETRDLAIFVQLVRYLGERAAVFVPSPQGGELTITSAEAASVVGCAEDDSSLALARELITNSVWEMWAGSGEAPDGTWQMALIAEKARAYRDVVSVDDVRRLHEPLAEQRRSWARAIADTARDTPSPTNSQPQPEAPTVEVHEAQANAVFVVYGRNDLARAAMFEFLIALGLEPLSWEKLLAATGEAAPYVGQVLASGFAVARAVVVFLTPDDEARLRPAFRSGRDPAYETEFTPQARPNVLFEAGMALMSHPTRTVIVELGQLRPFSDVAGRHAVRINDSIEQRRALIGRLQTAGCPVDLNGDWERAGEFSRALSAATNGEVAGATTGDGMVRFALQGEPIDGRLRGGPITLLVENLGPTDHFEATVTGVHGSREARPPWHVRWRHSTRSHQEILTDHDWRLELCEDDPTPADHQTAPRWRFFLPDGETLVTPDGAGADHRQQGSPLRVTIKVTPRDNPKYAIANTITLSMSERGRAAAWDRWRID